MPAVKIYAPCSDEASATLPFSCTELGMCRGAAQPQRNWEPCHCLTSRYPAGWFRPRHGRRRASFNEGTLDVVETYSLLRLWWRLGNEDTWCHFPKSCARPLHVRKGILKWDDDGVSQICNSTASHRRQSRCGHSSRLYHLRASAMPAKQGLTAYWGCARFRF